MHIFRALLLSSKSQAETFEREPTLSLTISPGRVLYRLLATHSPGTSPEKPSDLWTLRLYRATYPNHKEGKGWGEPHFAETPHKTCQFDDQSKLFNYLRRLQFAPESAWKPVEDDKEEFL